jgi:hypothetical protein
LDFLVFHNLFIAIGKNMHNAHSRSPSVATILTTRIGESKISNTLIVIPVSVSILDGNEQQDARTASPATPAEPPIGQMPMKSLVVG